MEKISKQSGSRNEFIVNAWERLACSSLGELELDQIREDLAFEFGDNVVESPARIAGILAEFGVKLRHAEILSADSKWRYAQFFELFGPEELKFQSLEEAHTSILKLEELRLVFETENDRKGLDRLRALALSYKGNLLLTARSEKLLSTKAMANEVLEWITLWLQNPQIFSDWLELRRKSPDFLSNFHL